MRTNFTILLLFLIPVFSAQLATAQTTFSNTNAITINDNAAATPYPSSIVVSGISGTIVSISVKINGFSHQFPSDVYMLLVGPGGQNFIFWGGAGGATEVSGRDITINDAASSALPQNSLITGTYRPSDYEAQYGLNVSFPSPAPASPYSKAAPTGSGTLASNFAGTSPNGTWNLYVEDVESGFAGSISGGWSITITHTVPSSTTTNLSSSNLSPYTASPNNSVTLTATVTSSSTVNGGTVTFKNGTNDISGCDDQAVSNGTATCITSFSSAGKDTLSAEYNGTVNFAGSSGGNVVENIYQHPTLSIDDVSEYEGNSGTTTFTFTVTSSSPAGPGITFDVGTADNTATTTDNDYVANSLTNQSIHQDSTTYTFDVTVNGDTKVEPDENFYVNLSNVSANASISDGQGTGTIQNDDCTPQTYYADNDGDTYGDPGNSIQSCTQPDGYVTDHTDCNDNDAAINPATVWYKDADDDGYSDGTTQTQCERPSGYKLATELTATSGDCNDNDAAINPATVWYKDADNDGYSDGSTQTRCERPSGYKLATELTATSRDCDDDNVAINPATVWYKDADDDGYSDGTTQTQCERPSGYKLATELIATSGDCNDGNAAINPGAVEICGNGIDDNCNGQIDENCVAVCQNATGLTTTNITATSAQLNWTATVNAVQWQVQYKTTNQGAKWMNVSSTLTGGNVRSVTISGLKSKQAYNWHIRAKCGKTWTSYSNAVKFKTLATGANAITISNASTNEKDNAIMKLYPNPTRGQFILELHVQNNINTKATLQLIDITGKTVQTENAEFNNGSLQRTVTLSQGLTQGIYMVRIVVNGTIYKTQFVYTK